LVKVIKEEISKESLERYGSEMRGFAGVGTGASFGMGQSSFGMSDIEDIWWRLIRKLEIWKEAY
jgi:hypothetical protein